MNQFDDDAAIAAKVRFLNYGIAPPPELEDRVIARLRAEKLLRSGGTVRSILKVSFAAAAIIVVFFSGILYQSRRIEHSSTVSMSDKTYVLFLREGAGFQQPRTESELQARVKAYRDWAVELSTQGVPITGTKLHDEATFLNVSGLEPQIGGYFLVDAATYQEAMTIANSCPHLKYGGAIEVRRVHPV